MRAISIMLLSVMLAFPASADDLMASNGKDRVFLTDKPCEYPPVVAMLKPAFVPLMRAASAVVQGRAYMACWVVQGSDAALLYEDGDQGLIPLEDFKRVPSV